MVEVEMLSELRLACRTTNLIGHGPQKEAVVSGRVESGEKA